jgi:hypothetical protein
MLRAIPAYHKGEMVHPASEPDARLPGPGRRLNTDSFLVICDLHQVYFRQGEAERLPCIKTARQGADALHSVSFQHQRHPGAGRFVGSSAVQDDVVIAWDLRIFLVQIFR